MSRGEVEGGGTGRRVGRGEARCGLWGVDTRGMVNELGSGLAGAAETTMWRLPVRDVRSSSWVFGR